METDISLSRMSLLDECTSLASSFCASADGLIFSDGDDESTLVAEEFENVWMKDVSQMKKLLQHSTSDTKPDRCPSCQMTFDRGKRRKLIDTCGHQRCYTCLFQSEACPLCNINGLTDLSLMSIYNNNNDGQLQTSRESNHDGPLPRNKMKTNGYFNVLKFKRDSLERNGSSQMVQNHLKFDDDLSQKGSQMSQSCPTPPRIKKIFQSSPKNARAISQREKESKVLQKSSDSVQNEKVGTMSMDSSMDGWGSKVLSKIKSLWSSTGSNTSVGLNQLTTDYTNASKPRLKMLTAQNDLYTRLGLLLRDDKTDKRAASEKSAFVSTNSLVQCNVQVHRHSTDTSPVSTLTGSSEADVHRSKRSKFRGTDSLSSLMSISMSGNSNSSSSPLIRRHMISNVKEDTRKLKKPPPPQTNALLDPKIKYLQYKNTPQLALKPLFFEVPLQEPDPLFLGRQWLFREMEQILETQNGGVLINGDAGTGKTAIILQMVDFSCFGRRKDHGRVNMDEIVSDCYHNNVSLTSEKIKQLASHVVAYHFCQADNSSTCLIPEFVHSIAAQLCQAPHLAVYREYVLSDSYIRDLISFKSCVTNPTAAFVQGILEPLQTLRQIGKIDSNKYYLILIDGLCEAEYHRPDFGDTIASFLAKHSNQLPNWLKIIATVRSQFMDVAKQLPFVKISLDAFKTNENIQKDLLDYINFRLNNSPSIQDNITIGAVSNYNLKFAEYMLNASRGSFLFTKLTLDLLERGSLVVKSSGYKIIPVTLGEIFLLHFNLRFATVASFEKVSHILNVCLAALYPLTLIEIYYSINSLLVDTFLPWDEFLQRFKLLSGFLIKRLDNTYMFFHPAFREWLIHRDQSDNCKFLCDLRAGHAAIAFRLSRVQAPLDAEKTLELGHHILKAHVYRSVPLNSRDLQATWIANTSVDISESLCCLRNIYNPNVKVSRLLLLGNASPNHVTKYLDNSPVLNVYAYEGIVPMVSLLLEFGATCDQSNDKGETALMLACARGHCDIVRQLITAGSCLGRVDKLGHTSLTHAARNGHLNVVAYLLACDWTIKDEQNDLDLIASAQQALVLAASEGHMEIVEYLLDMSEIDADFVDRISNDTALTAACTNGRTAVVQTLISRGANVSVANKRGMTAMLLAVKEGYWAITEKLLQDDQVIEQTDANGRSALTLAAVEEHVGLIELLLEKGADIEKEDNEGLTPLCWACLHGRLQAAICLLEKGANLNHCDKTSRTPLDFAAYNGNAVLVQLLIDKGAVIEHADVNGMRPIDRAVGCGHIGVVQSFLKRGAKLGPVTWSMATGKLDIVLCLLNKLLEDGNVLYRKNRLQEACFRYQYALRKFPNDDLPSEHIPIFHQLKINFLLNQSRCKRKMNALEDAVDLANQVLSMKPDSFEAYYARAKARVDMSLFETALVDVQEALNLAPQNNRDITKVLTFLRDSLKLKILNKDKKY